MSDRILVATRKGLFSIEPNGTGGARWAISKVDFLADNVSIAMADTRDGRPILKGLRARPTWMLGASQSRGRR